MRDPARHDADWILRWGSESGLTAEEGWLTARDLAEADEAFLSSSVAGILPVTRFAGASIGERARPGRGRSAREPTARRSSEAWRHDP